MRYTIETSRLNGYQKSVVKRQSVERQKFIENQINICKDSMMKGSIFMSADGKCYRCHADVIDIHIKNGNDGSNFVTGCPECHRSYCD